MFTTIITHHTVIVCTWEDKLVSEETTVVDLIEMLLACPVSVLVLWIKSRPVKIVYNIIIDIN